jgi:hypothetical protein
MFKMSLAFIWALPFAAVAAVVGITIVFIPFAYGIAAFGCMPLVIVIRNHEKRKLDWLTGTKTTTR